MEGKDDAVSTETMSEKAVESLIFGFIQSLIDQQKPKNEGEDS